MATSKKRKGVEVPVIQGTDLAAHLSGLLGRPKLARERKITGTGPVDVRESLLRQLEGVKRAIFNADGKPISDSRAYVEVAKRERVGGAGNDALWLTMADGTEWQVTVRKMR